MKNTKFTVANGLLILIAPLFAGCGTATYEIPINLVNKSGQDIANLKILFINQTFQKFYAGQEHTFRLNREAGTDFVSDKHIEYTINEKKYDGAYERGPFAGKTISLKMGQTVFITLYADYYTLEVEQGRL